ncbi:unnamed protein product [Arabidopsis halleri]
MLDRLCASRSCRLFSFFFDAHDWDPPASSSSSSSLPLMFSASYTQRIIRRPIVHLTPRPL